MALIGAVPKSAATSEATKDLVGEIRGHGTALHQDTGADLMVTGLTAVNIDVSTKLSDALIPYLADRRGPGPGPAPPAGLPVDR